MMPSPSCFSQAASCAGFVTTILGLPTLTGAEMDKQTDVDAGWGQALTILVLLKSDWDVFESASALLALAKNDRGQRLLQKERYSMEKPLGTVWSNVAFHKEAAAGAAKSAPGINGLLFSVCNLRAP